MKTRFFLLLFIVLFMAMGVYAQSSKQNKKILLQGLVLDNENNPVQNVSVFLDGKNTNVVSDSEGRFKIKVSPKVKVIMVFSLSNGDSEIKYNGEDELTFILSSATKMQEDPMNKPKQKDNDMIDVGYGKAHKQNLTTSVGEVNEEHLKNATHYANIYDMIKGEVAGVEVNGRSITIRGTSSINLSNEPLFVVNGSPVSDISDISPYDVKSISILKGSSAAMYGSRGANGVILITLKSGGNN